eukprot:GFYU01010747.1.p1 GENE.GFYU01010747.1~~GFYU01010747.1.p1  ORF type:complete len:509 (-),score=184.09 GFYU01010747.1:65-1591(-)
MATTQDPKIDLDRMLKNQMGERVSSRDFDRDSQQRSTIRRIQNITNHISKEKTYEEPAKRIPVRYDDVDVLVVGGGPAGLAAAISAKWVDKTKKVMILDFAGCFGGTITQVGMESIYWYKYEGTAELGGFGAYLEKCANELGATSKFPANSSNCLQTEIFKVVADKMIKDNGVIPLLHTKVVDVIMSLNTITGVVAESKSGRFAIYAKRVIDASGDGDVAFLAGAKMTVLELDQRMGITQVFNVKGLNKEKFQSHLSKNMATYKDWGHSDGEFEQDTEGKEDHLASPYFKELQGVDAGLGTQNASIDGTWSTVTPHGEVLNLNLVHFKNVDGLHVEDLTRCEMDGRENAMKAIGLLQKNIPGFEDVHLRNFAHTVGIRDTRKLHAVYNITHDDVMNDGRFDDAVGSFVRFVDGYSQLVLPIDGRRFQIPLRCLISPDVKNLMVAGRCIGGDSTSHASVRNMGCTFVTGQAAGVCSGVSLRIGTDSTDYQNATYVKNAQVECENQNMVI